MRLNNIEYLPVRDSKHDSMVKLLPLNNRDKLLSIIGCNRLDKVDVYYNNGKQEEIDISKLPVMTMGSPAKKVTEHQNAVNTYIVKTKLK